MFAMLADVHYNKNVIMFKTKKTSNMAEIAHMNRLPLMIRLVMESMTDSQIAESVGEAY